MSSVSSTYDKRMTSILCAWLAKNGKVGNTFGIRWPYAIHTLAIRQLYASCMLNTLLNRPAYAKMSIYVADTLQIRQTYVRSMLLMRY